MLNRRSFLSASALALVAAGCQSPCGRSACGACARDVKFNFGFAGYSFYRCSLDETLAIMKKLDMHYLCIKDFHLPMKATAAEIKTFHQKCADAGVTGYGVGPIYMRTNESAQIAFDYAARVGVKTVVSVPCEMQTIKGKELRVASRARCEFLSDLCAKYDMCVAIHNHGPDIPYCFPTGDSAYEMVKDLDKRMGLCLDIGHNFRAGLDPAASIRKLSDRIYDVHVKNVKANAKGHKVGVPMPRGEMDLVSVVKALVDVGYTGCCSLEYEAFPPKGVKPGVNLDEIAESVGYFKGLMKSVQG